MIIVILLSFLLQNSKPEVRIPDLEQKIHQSINVQRQATNAEPLSWDDELGKLARAHSEDMAKRNYFKHITPEGLTPMKRLQEAGYNRCRLVGENIHQNNLYSRAITERKRTTYEWNSMDQISAMTMKAWMDSEGHLQILVDKEYTREGIGVAVAADDKVYITQISCGEAN